MLAVEIGQGSNPTILVDCGIHAREWASHTLCIYLISELVEGSLTHWTEDIYWIIYLG